MTNYVLGFLFKYPAGHPNNEVVLIKKNKPEWQAGLLNGVGGKVEDSDINVTIEHGVNSLVNLHLPLKIAIKREFKEETGVESQDWLEFGRIEGKGYNVYLFKNFNEEYFNAAQSMEEEKIEKWPLNDLPGQKYVSNLLWLIHAALDSNQNKPFYLTANYQ